MFSPFAGLRFDSRKVSSIADVTSPPYDVISPAEHVELQRRSAHNIVHVLLAAEGDPTYQAAAERYSSWRREGVLVRDPSPRFYLYLMDYIDPAGTAQTARGILGALDVIELGERVVGHEETMAKHRADRLAVLTATEANLDVIIALSSSPDLGGLLDPVGDPIIDFMAPDQVRHRLYPITEGDRIAAISEAVASHAVAIADGHHRYTTALAYRESRAADGSGGWDAILALVAPAEGSGLTVGPYHRVFPSIELDHTVLADAFTISTIAAAAPQQPGDLVVVDEETATLLSPRPEALDPLPLPWREASPAVARELLYPLVGISEDDSDYVADAADAIARATAGGAALLVAPVSEHAIAEAGDMGIRFPQKTTYFVPKPRAGLVVRTLTD
jgi:uncharacterized protein (DUF1015 family)